MFDKLNQPSRIADRFRGFLPVVVDVETAGFDCQRHALLEIAAIIIYMDTDGWLYPGQRSLVTYHHSPAQSSTRVPWHSIRLTPIILFGTQSRSRKH